MPGSMKPIKSPEEGKAWALEGNLLLLPCCMDILQDQILNISTHSLDECWSQPWPETLQQPAVNAEPHPW